jgi:hypothetical protein
MKNTIYILLLLTGLISCQKEIQIDLNSSDPKVVIQAEVTDQELPYTVKINKTVNFSESSIYPPVEGALVIISDNAGNSDTLSEVTPGLYQSPATKGIPGREYKLTVVTNGNTFTAVSHMPAVVPLNYLAAIESNFGPPGNDTAYYFIVPHYTDPVGLGNCYRFFQFLKNKRSKSINIFNDNINDGLPNQRPVFDPDVEIHLGDTVGIEMQCIDRSNYDYFYSLSQSSGNGPGGGATPANPVTNIQGGALGYFSAHTIEQKTIIVK